MTLADLVYYYMPDDQASDQSNRGKYNCSEAMLRAINTHYDLNISEDAQTQMAAFGGGLFVGDVCGLLIGGYAGLAHLYASSEAPKANDQLKTACKEWYTRFNTHFATVKCKKMKPESGGCSSHARKSAAIFEALVAEIGRP